MRAIPGGGTLEAVVEATGWAQTGGASSSAAQTNRSRRHKERLIIGRLLRPFIYERTGPGAMIAARHISVSRRFARGSRRSARAGGREGDNVADRRAVGQQHDEPVDAKAKSAAGRQPVFERRDVILVERLRLLVAGGARQHLRLEAGALIERVVQFGEGVGDLPAIDVGLEALDKPRIVAVGLGERRDIAREACHMDRLDQLVLDARGKSGFQRMPPALITLQGAAELLR